MFKQLVYFAALFAFSAGCVDASGLSEITGIHIDLNQGRVHIDPPNLGAIPGVIRNLPQDVAEALLNPVAPAIATAIRYSRGQARNRGVQPMPTMVRQALAPYFPPQILDKVRWTTAAGISLDGALSNWLNSEGAITYDDVIVFSAGIDAQANVGLWAHELTHVLQYAQLGIESFAFQYLYDWGDLESQADENADRTMASIASTQAGQPSTWGFSGQPAMGAQQPSWQLVNQRARQSIDPGQCIWVDNQTNRTGNRCPVTIVVTAAVVQRFNDGSTYTIPCNVPTCVFFPGDDEPLISPVGGQIIAALAAYRVP